MFKPTSSRGLALLTMAALLSACGGGSHSGSVVPTVGGGGSGGDQPAGTPATATFSFTIVKDAAGSAGRVRPAYVSLATKSISIQVTDTKNTGDNSDIYANVPAALKAVQSVNFANLTGNPNTPGQCGTDPSNPGNYKCTGTYQLPVGTNTVAISDWSGNGATGNKLSGQIGTYVTLQGAANAYSVILDANAATTSVSGTTSCTNGPIGASFGSIGTTPQTLTVGFTDLSGKTIVAPGLPTIQVLDHNGVWQPASGTINGSGGTVAFAVNQSAQTVTLTPSNSGITSVSVNVRGVPPSGTDGLSFAATKAFTYSAGVALPSSFLTVIEQLGAASGQLDLYTVSLGATDTFTPYHTINNGTALAVTSSLNEGKPDIDNPRAMLFNATGDILLANGGQGGTGGDFGDFACIPSGAISTGAAISTTSSTNALDPQSIELGTDNSVVIGNVPASATYNAVTYVLGSVYAPAAASRSIANGSSLGTFAVVALPTAPQAGTFAAAITNGTTVSRVTIKSPDGTETNLTDSTIYDPQALAWDGTNGQLAIAGGVNGTGQAYLDFYTIAGTKVKSIIIRNDGGGNSLLEGDLLAASADGHIAVAGVGATGLPEVQVYDNTATRATVGGDIPFDACVDAGCSSNVYGLNAVVTSVHFLSNTKLLVTLSDTSTIAKQGVYIYDISQLVAPCTCFDPFTGLQQANSPKATGFQQFSTNPPLGAAYKP
jgi:hypothetical protein